MSFQRKEFQQKDRRPNTRLAVKSATSPYNFVPHNREVVLPEWQNISIDRPQREGISGSLTIRLHPKTPLIVADREEVLTGKDAVKVRTHFRHIDGKPGIPGSTLRGMLRSVVEIVSYSKMSRIDERYFGIRDLQNPDLYGKHMAQIVGGEPTPLVCAGWLSPNTGFDAKDFPAILRPCDYSKIEYTLIERLASERLTGQHRKSSGGEYSPGRKQSAPDKYTFWFGKERIQWDQLQIHCSVDKPFYDDNFKSIPRIGTYYRKTLAVRSSGIKGHLVFTGQPSTWDPKKIKMKQSGNPKHHDFVFYDQSYAELKIPKKVFNGFLTAHAGSGEQHKLTDSLNDELSFWMRQSQWARVQRGQNKATKFSEEIPVFFLMRNDEKGKPVVRSIGLAQMFRLAYDHTTKEMAPQFVAGTLEKEDISPDKMDLAELLFGRVDDEKSLRGRIQIGHAQLKGSAVELPLVKAVLGGPKASFYPYYIEQDLNIPGRNPANPGGKAEYKTYMDTTDKAQIRGRKRYVIRPTVTAPAVPMKNGVPIDNDKICTHFKPVNVTDGYFETQINVHNALPEEVGAILWALTFGGQENTYHQLGMAKSLGYGAVHVEIADSKLYSIKSVFEDDAETVSLKGCKKRFEEWITGYIPKWASERRMFELLQMATPLHEEESQQSRHPDLNSETYGNMFVGIKKSGLALPSRGSTVEYQRWSYERQAKERERLRAEAHAKEEAQRVKEEAQRAEEAAHWATLSPLQQAQELIGSNVQGFMLKPWYKWVRDDEVIVERLPKFSELDDTHVLFEWWNLQVDLKAALNQIPHYDRHFKGDLKTLLEQVFPEMKAEVSERTLPNKIFRALKHPKKGPAAAKQMIGLLMAGNVNKKDVEKGILALQEAGLIEQRQAVEIQRLYGV